MTHTVKSGETLGTIAAKYLGDKSRYTQILAANPQITNPNLIKVGQVIKIPTTTQSIVNTTQTATTRPTGSVSSPLVPTPITPTPLLPTEPGVQVAQESFLDKLKSRKGLLVMLLIGAGFYFYSTKRAKRA